MKENPDQLNDTELTQIGAELVKLAGVGNPKHPKLRHDIDAAYFIAKHSDRFRAIVNERLGGSTLTLRDMQRINSARSARWMAGSPGWTILEIAGELCGEAGELANICKKLRRSEMGVPGNKLSDDELRAKARGEIGDVLIVLMLVAAHLGIDVHEAARDAFNAKSEQMGFPERFDAAGAR